jgi:hypothetical protein
MKKLIVFAALLNFYSIVKAQEKDIHINLEVQGVATTTDIVPFWLRSNQFGSIPLAGGSGSFIGKLRKDYDPQKTVDWAASFEGRTNVGKQTQFNLIEGFVKAHVGVFELKAGRSKDIVGLTDSTLSSGSFPISGNALGIPKIGISIPNYYSIPIFGKLFAVKGSLAVGHIGNIHFISTKAINLTTAQYLENTLYARIGKPQWRFKFYAGYNHEAIWADQKDVFGPGYNLSGFETFWHVLTGKVYNSSKIGNHLGSLDFGAEYRFDALTLFLYRQNIYDIGALNSLANLADGLNGIRFTNNKPNGNFYWKKILFEFLYTANQAGYANSKQTKSGAEDYYNNAEYVEGWSYKNQGLGSPFITPAIYARDNLPTSPFQFFINNRVLALHTAAEFSVFKWLYITKLSYSVNYGTFANGSEPYRSVYGLQQPSGNGVFKKVNQFSAYFEGIRPLKKGYSIGCDIGYDHGELLYNSFGAIIKVSKSFL